MTGIIWGPGFWVFPKASHFSNPTGYVEQGDRARAMLSRTVNSSQERFQVLVSWSILFWKFNMDQRSHTEFRSISSIGLKMFNFSGIMFVLEVYGPSEV